MSIWRLTNDRQVWYEWHAESFISVPTCASRGGDELLPLTPGLPVTPSFSALGAPAPSPLADSREPPFLDTTRLTGNENSGSRDPSYELVKIGHTSLHNPGGRSSWIGL